MLPLTLTVLDWDDRIPDYLTGPKRKEIKVETFRVNYLIRSPKAEKLGFEPVSYSPYSSPRLFNQVLQSSCLLFIDTEGHLCVLAKWKGFEFES